jgi:ribosomal protein S1
MLPTDTTNPKTASPNQLLKNELSALPWPREGAVVTASLLKKTAREVFFDLGRFGTGVVYGAELANARDVIKNLNPGDQLLAKVVDLDGEGGYIELSISEASKQRLWQQAQELLENGELTKVKVAAVNPSGLIVYLGDLKAFLPYSQVSPEHLPKEEGAESDRRKTEEEMRKLIGTELSVKVINVNPKRNKLVVSERESVSVNLKELLSAYQVGQTVDGLVAGIADFGVFVRFVDNPQIEGLVHISEIDHRLIDNPKEVVKMNESVKVKIIDIKDGRVFLSLKALKDDPWNKAEEFHKTGDEIEGRVYKLNPFGAVINLPSGLQGTIHVSEFGGVEEMKAALTPGEPYRFTIETVKPEEKRIALKLKK